MTPDRLAPQVFLLAILVSVSARAEESYYRVSLADLSIQEEDRPVPESVASLPYWALSRVGPRVILDVPGEGWVVHTETDRNAELSLDNVEIVVRTDIAEDVRGRVILPRRGTLAPWVGRFRIPLTKRADEHRDAFLEAGEKVYDRLKALRPPGAAWFRQRAWEYRSARLGVDAAPMDDSPLTPPWRAHLDETFSLFSGGRAVAENLQLHRILSPRDEAGTMESLQGIEGITIDEIDWAPLVEGKSPEMDRWAYRIPADQYAVFFPSPRALIRLVDEARILGGIALQWVESRAEDAKTWERTQRQLCLPLWGPHRFLTGLMVGAVAVTGSDPFLRTGSDVAVLVEAPTRQLIWVMLGRHFLAARVHADATRTLTVVDGRVVYGVATPDRRLSSYVAPIPGGLLVANSMVQVRRVLAVVEGRKISLAETSEMRFFRDRYPLGNEGEAAFIVVPDAAFRAWAGPRVRILTSRRIRMAGALAALRARRISEDWEIPEAEVRLRAKAPVPDAGRFLFGPRGIRSERYGTLGFLTPISELETSSVTPGEASAYRRFRTNYQGKWRAFLDPIGARLEVGLSRVAADVSVFPVILRSRYRDFMDLTSGVQLPASRPAAPQDEMFRFGMAIRRDSELIQDIQDIQKEIDLELPGLEGGALSWLGTSLEVVVADDPLWAALVDTEKLIETLSDHGFQIPILARISVRDQGKVEAFVGALKDYADLEEEADMEWREGRQGKHTYGCLRRWMDWEQTDEWLEVCVAVAPGVLSVSTSECLLQRTLARADSPAGMEAAGWVGNQVAMEMDARSIPLLRYLREDKEVKLLQRISWTALPILNEWRARYPERDPLDVHEDLWGIRLRCPGGEGYVWDPEWQTMASAIYGHPAAPKRGPGLLRPPLDRILRARLGLTFELGGLRARVSLDRESVPFRGEQDTAGSTRGIRTSRSKPSP